MGLRIRFTGGVQSTVFVSVRLLAEGTGRSFKPLPNPRCAQVSRVCCLDAQFKLLFRGFHLTKIVFHEAQDVVSSALPMTAETYMKRLHQLLFSAFILTKLVITMTQIVANETLP